MQKPLRSIAPSTPPEYRAPMRRAIGESVREQLRMVALSGTHWIILDAGTGLAGRVERTYYTGKRAAGFTKIIAPGFGTQALVGIYVADKQYLTAHQLATVLRGLGNTLATEQVLSEKAILCAIPGDEGAALLGSFVDWMLHGAPGEETANDQSAE